MAEPCCIVIPRGGDEDLRLPAQPPERVGVDDAVSVALERRPDRRLLLRLVSMAVGASGGPRCQCRPLQRFEPLANRPAPILRLYAVQRLELHVPGRSRERNDVTYVLHAGDELHHAFEPEAEPSMRYRAVPA